VLVLILNLIQADIFRQKNTHDQNSLITPSKRHRKRNSG
jgi:hypothetical protein